MFFEAADLQRNKRSLAVNLQDPRGVAIVKRLAARADVVVENYPPDVKHRLGVDYDALSRDTREVLESLGYDAATVETLLAEGVIEQHKGETS